jgi:hypothetical protein
MAGRKLSRVSAEEMAGVHASLFGLFDQFKDGVMGITAAGCQRFAADAALLDSKLTASEVGLIFSGVKLQKKEELGYGQFVEAVRKMAAKKGVTYQELIQAAEGTTPKIFQALPVTERWKIFVSWRMEESKPQVEELQKALEELGAEVLVVKESPGSSLLNAVSQALEEADMYVIMGTETYGKETSGIIDTHQEMQRIKVREMVIQQRRIFGLIHCIFI